MTTHRKDESAPHKPKAKQSEAAKPAIKGSWPDGETRQQMSQSENQREIWASTARTRTGRRSGSASNVAAVR